MYIHFGHIDFIASNGLQEKQKTQTTACIFQGSRFNIQVKASLFLLNYWTNIRHMLGTWGALWVTYVYDTRLGYFKRLTNDNQTVLICFNK